MSIALDPSKVNSEIIDKISKAKSAMQEAYNYSGELYNSLPSSFSYKSYTKQLKVNVENLKTKIDNAKTKINSKYESALNIEFNHSSKVNSLLTNFPSMTEINGSGNNTLSNEKSISSDKKTPSDSLGTKIATKCSSIFGRLKNQVQDVSEKVATFCCKAKSAIGNAVEKAWDWVSDGDNWKRLGTKISNGAKSAWNFVTDKENYIKLGTKIADYTMDWIEDPVGTFLKTGASILNLGASFLKGLISLVEALTDFAMILVAVKDSIGTVILDEIAYLWSGESLGLTENMWKKKVVPAVSYNWTNALDEKIGFRQWLDNYAYDAFKTDGIACQISEGVGYVTGIIAISALTFGVGGAAAGGMSSLSAGTTAIIAGAAGMGKGIEEAWSQQADQKVLQMATAELNKEIEQGIVTQEMFDKKVQELLKENPEIQLTEEDVSVAIYNDLLAKKVEGINKRPGARELSNDEIVGGLGYGTMTGVIDGVQWYAGQKINGLFRGSGTKITNKAVASLLRMGADTVDAVAEIPFRTYAQTLYRTDENGNKMSFSEVFEANGGWNQVKVQAGIAGVASGFGEVIDVTSSARNVKKMTSFLDGSIKPRNEITDKIIDKVNKSISKMKDIDAKNYLESLDGVERVKAFDQMKINQQMAKSLNSLDDISLKKFYDSLDEGKQSQILGMVDESKKSFLVAQSGDEVARSLSADQVAIESQKDSFNKDMEDIRNNDSLSEIEKATQVRKIWEEDLKSLFGEENVMADEVDEVISKSNKVQQGVRWENSANERELIEKLYGKRETLSPDTITELEQNQYWQRIVKQNEENLQIFNTRFKNYSDTYSPRILTDDEVLLAQRTMSDAGQLRDLRWTYMQRNLGIDMNNVPESVLTAEVKSLDDALFQEIGSTNSYYRQVCIEDLIGSATKSGDAQTGYTFFEKMLLDKGYDINAKTHMFTDPVNALKSDFPDSNIGKEAMTGNRAIDLLEHNGKYYIGEDGNHRMVTLKVKFLAEMEKAVTAEEKALVRAKYTFTLPVKSLDLPIPDINSSSVANSISASTMADSISATTIAENLNASTVADVTTMAKNIDDNLFDSRNLPLSNDTQLRSIQEKMLNGEDLTMFEKIRLRDHVETTIEDYALKENYAYRVVDEDAWNIYLKNKKIYSQSEDYILSADGMTSQGNGGCDWYLGGYASKYGTNGKSSYVIETPANKRYFQLAKDNGNGMSDNVNVRHLKSFNTHDQVPLENVTKVFKIDPDGTITEINLKNLLDDEVEIPKLTSEVKNINGESSLVNEGNIVDDVASNNISSSKVSIKGIKNAINNFSYKILSNPTISDLMVNPALPHLIANGDKVLGGFILGTAFDMFKAKRTVTNVLDSANMTSQIKRDGIVHITSSNAADSIIDSGVLKAATKKGKQIINQGQNTYFFKGGELDFDEVLINVNTTPTLVGVKIKPSDSQLGSLGFRNLDDNALIHNGDFDLAGADSVEKVYYGLKLNEKTKKLYYSEISKQEYDNYKLDFNSYQTKMINNNFTETLLMLKSQLEIRRKRLLETVDGTNSSNITSIIDEDAGIKNVNKAEINPFAGDETYKKSDLSKFDNEVEIPKLANEINASTVSSSVDNFSYSNGLKMAGDLIDDSNVLKRAGDLTDSASPAAIRSLDLNRIKEFNSAEVAFSLKNGDSDVIKRVFKESELSKLKKSLSSLSDTEINKVMENIDLVDYHKLYRVLSESDIVKRIDVLSDKGLNKVINMLRAEKNGLELLSMNKEFVDGIALKANVDTLKVIFSTNAETLKYKLSKQLDDATLLSLVSDGDGYFENLLKKYPLSEWISNKEEAAKFVPVFLRDNVIKPENFAEIDSIIKKYNLGRNFSHWDREIYFMVKSRYEQFVFENASDINVAKNIMMNKSPDDLMILLSTEHGRKVFKNILYTVDDVEFNKYLSRLDDFSQVGFDGIDEAVSLMKRMDTDNIDTLIHSCDSADINEILNKLDSTQLNRLLKMSFQYANTSTALTNSDFLERAISLNLFSNSDFNMFVSQIIKNDNLNYKNFKTIQKYSSSTGFFKKYHLNLGDYDSRVLDATTFGYNIMMKNFKKQFGRFLPEGRLESIYDSFIFKSQEDFIKLGHDNAMAFNNPQGQSVMNVDIHPMVHYDDVTRQTVLKANINHESIHQLSRIKGSFSGVNNTEVYRGINECFTELFNKKSLGKDYPKVAYCAYQPAVKELERLLNYGKIKDKEIFSIYFNNNINQLDDLFKKKFNLDDNQYQELINAFYKAHHGETDAVNELNKMVTSIILR